MEDFDFDSDDMTLLRTTLDAYCKTHATCGTKKTCLHPHCRIPHPDINSEYVDACRKILRFTDTIRGLEERLAYSKRIRAGSVDTAKREQAVFKGDLVAARPDSSKKRKRLSRKCKYK